MPLADVIETALKQYAEERNKTKGEKLPGVDTQRAIQVLKHEITVARETQNDAKLWNTLLSLIGKQKPSSEESAPLKESSTLRGHLVLAATAWRAQVRTRKGWELEAEERRKQVGFGRFDQLGDLGFELSQVDPKKIHCIADSAIPLESTLTFAPLPEFLFPERPQVSDVSQSTVIGDCYLLAGAMSIVSTRPELICRMMCQRGKFVFVRLYTKGVPFYYQLAMTKVVLKKGLSGNAALHKAAWVYVLEKAYSVHRRLNGDSLRKAFGKMDASSTYVAALTSGESDEVLAALLGAKAEGETIDFINDEALPEQVGTPLLNWLDFKFLFYARADEELEEDIAQVFVRVFESTESEDGKAFLACNTEERAERIQEKIEELTHEELSSGGLARVEKLLRETHPDLPTGVMKRLSTLLAEILPGRTGTGKYTKYQLRLYEAINLALIHGKMVCLGTRKTLTGEQDEEHPETLLHGLAGSHAYQVVRCRRTSDIIKGTELRFLKLRNPWGQTGRTYKLSNDKQGMEPKATKDGEFFLELSDLTTCFDMYYVGEEARSVLQLRTQDDLQPRFRGDFRTLSIKGVNET